ncbi:hypothetical protein WMY93_000822 [Mugilogobius chulae]|uniref:Uncharacterized protein n=1 Tax=Mugilogobius chulae TaxID=88201 RepID=A0AAW0QFB0_9GOBI
MAAYRGAPESVSSRRCSGQSLARSGPSKAQHLSEAIYRSGDLTTPRHKNIGKQQERRKFAAWRKKKSRCSRLLRDLIFPHTRKDTPTMTTTPLLKLIHRGI